MRSSSGYGFARLAGLAEEERFVHDVHAASAVRFGARVLDRIAVA